MPFPQPRLAVLAAFLANGVGIGAWAASVPAVQHRFGLAPLSLGLLLLGLGVGSIVAMALSGQFVAWLGSARAMRAIAWGMAALLPLPLLAPSIPLLALAIALLGMAAGSGDVAMNAQGAEVERLAGRPMMSSFHAGFSMGGLAGALCGSLFGLAWSALPVACLALAASLLAGVADRPSGQAAPRLALPNRAMLGLCALAGASMLSEGAVSDWSGIYLRDTAHMPVAWVGAGFATFSASMVAARLGGDRALRRLGVARGVRLGGLLAAAGLALALALPSPAWVLAGLALVGLGLGNVVPAVYSAGARVRSVTPATGIAMVATVGYGGFLLGPPIVGFVAEVAGLRLGLIAVVAVCLAIAGLARLLAR